MDIDENYRMTLLKEMSHCDDTSYQGIKSFCDRNNVNPKELLIDVASWIVNRMQKEQDD